MPQIKICGLESSINTRQLLRSRKESMTREERIIPNPKNRASKGIDPQFFSSISIIDGDRIQGNYSADKSAKKGRAVAVLPLSLSLSLGYPIGKPFTDQILKLSLRYSRDRANKAWASPFPILLVPWPNPLFTSVT